MNSPLSKPRRTFLKRIAAGSAFLASCGPGSSENPASCVPDIADFRKIDLHTHISSDAAYLREIMDKLNFKMFTINNEALKKERLNLQEEVAVRICRELPRYYAWCTTFPLDGIQNRDWPGRVESYLRYGFDRGALAVKVWKEIGMQLKDRDGHFIQIDDPFFDPVFNQIESADKTLLAHIGDPADAWISFDAAGRHNAWYRENKNDVENRIGRFRGEVPYDTLIRARDQLIEKHPGLRIIGCHLGSMAHNLDEVAARLDRYPNFAVEISYTFHLVRAQAREKIRNFFMKYRDRILYGTDKSGGLVATPFLVDMSKADQRWSPEEIDKEKTSLMRQYRNDFDYLSTDGEFTNGNYTARGLALPVEVLRKIYYDNAVKWVPGIEKDYLGFPGS